MPSTSPLDSLRQNSLGFEANVGQTDGQVQFLARGQGYGLFLTSGEAVLNLYDPSPAGRDKVGTVLRAQFVGANLGAQATGLERQGGNANYFIGNDPAGWHTDVPVYARVQYHNIYPGIDLVYYGTSQSELEYDFVVAPGADPGVIKVAYEGAENLRLDAQGNLVLHTGDGDVVQHAPIIYQEVGGVRHAVAGAFVLAADNNEVRFQLGDYDSSLPLVIDPVLVYSTYHGGSGADDALDVAIDDNGAVYVTGFTRSANFPLRGGAYDNSLGGSSDAFVSKFNPNGAGFAFSTYLGGSGRENDATTIGGNASIAVGSGGASYITGYTQSADFPVLNALQANLQGTQDAFVTKLNGLGNALIYSTYLGGTGTEGGVGITVDTSPFVPVYAYITGWTTSTDFPVQGALQGTLGGGVDAFVTKLTTSGTGLVFSTYLGGGNDDYGLDATLDSSNNVYVTGRTLSSDFTTTAGLDTLLDGGSDAFVTKINASGSSLLFSTFLGGSADENLETFQNGNVGSIAVDRLNNVYVTGSTSSSNFPLMGPLDSTLSGTWDAFVTKLNSSGAPVYSTYLGGAGNDFGLGIAVDRDRNAFVTGYTESADFPTALPTQAALGGSRDAFVTVLDPSGFTLAFSTFLGGNTGTNGDIGRAIVVDFRSHAYVVGYTDSGAFPLLGPRQATFGGGGDGFLTKIAAVPGVAITELTGINSNTTDVTEGGRTDTIQLILNALPTANVILTLNPGSELSLSATTLTFTTANWNSWQTVTVTAVDDAAIEGNHTGTITTTSTSTDATFNGLSIGNVNANVTDNELPGVSIVENYGTTRLDETGATSDTYFVTLTSVPTANVFITLTPDSQLTVNRTVLTFTPANWFVAQVVVCTAVDDLIVETSPHAAVVSHVATSGDANYNGIAVPNMTANVNDNDTPGISNWLSNYAIDVIEGGPGDTYRMVLDTQPTADVVLTLTPNSQVTVTPTVFTFTPATWNVAQRVTVNAVDDTAVESNLPGTHSGRITYTLATTDVNYGGLVVPSAGVAITDNDRANLYLVQTGSTRVNEAGPTSDSYTAQLTSIPTGNVFVTLSPGGQVTVAPSVLTFTSANWYSPQTVNVTAVDDGTIEGTHNGVISHTLTSSDAAYNGLAVGRVTATITDDDSLSVFLAESLGSTSVSELGGSDTYQVRLGSQPTANVFVTLNPGSQLSVPASPLTFTPASWNVWQIVTVTAFDDLIAETTPYSGILTHSATSADPGYNGLAIPSITAAVTGDNDVPGVAITPSGGSTSVAEGGATDTYTVVLLSQPTANVTITLAPDAQLSGVPSTLVFSAVNWNSPQIVTVTAVDDFMVETSPHQGTIAHTVSSGDSFYNGLIAPTLTANITENDVGGIAVTQSGGSTSVTEGVGTDIYTLVLGSSPSANVVITVSPDAQVSVSATRLTFTPANWGTQQTVTITAVDDAIFEGNHTGLVTHTSTSTDPIYNGMSIGSVTASITDNDAVGIVQSGGATQVAESGGSDSYTLVLASQPTADVTIAFNPGTQLAVVPAPMTFTSLNWNVPQTVTVTAIDDARVEGLHSGVIGHTSSSADANYNGLTIVSVTAGILDNDTAGVRVLPSGGSTSLVEGGAGDSYDVVLTSQPTANVLITLGAGAQLTASTTLLTFTPAGWNSPQTVFLTAVEDGVAEGPHMSTIRHSASSGDASYQGIAVADLVAFLNDPAGITITPTTGPLTLLEGTSKSYTVVLNTAPTADVIITLAPDAQVATSPATLTFTSANWNVPRPVNVTAVADGVVEGPHNGVISHSVSSSDANYDLLNALDVTAALVDGDGAFVTGTSRADRIVVSTSANASTLSISVNGKLTSMVVPTQLVILGGDGADSIEINNVRTPVVVLGGSGIDRVFVFGQAGFNNYVLGRASLLANGNSIGLWDTENLIVNGQTSNDTFFVQATPAFAVELKGDRGVDEVSAADGVNTWKITSSNIGTLNNSIKLNGIENWTGGNAADTFVFSAGKGITGLLDGGAGSNTLNYALYGSAVTVNLQTRTASGTQGFRNIANIVGGRGSDRLIGADQNNDWNVTSFNAGNVAGVAFQSMENLTGGLLDDAFHFADKQGLSGKVDGAGGSDLLDYTAYLGTDVVINLQTKRATNTAGFANLEQFQAGAGLGNGLVGPNAINAWSLTGNGVGTLNGLAFSGFANLTGGSLVDNFTLEAGGDWLGLLNGGTGLDTLKAFSGQINTWVNTSATAGTLNGHKFQNIDSRR